MKSKKTLKEIFVPTQREQYVIRLFSYFFLALILIAVSAFFSSKDLYFLGILTYLFALIIFYFFLRDIKLKVTNKINKIIIILVVSLLFYVFSGFLLGQARIFLNFIHTFFKSDPTGFNIFYLFINLIFAIVVLEMLFSIVLHVIPNSKNLINNKYLTASIALISIILLVGVSQIKEIYKEELPLTLSNNSNGNASLHCDSTSNRVYFSEEDKLSCTLSSELNEGFEYLEIPLTFYTNFRERQNYSDFGYLKINSTILNYYLVDLTLTKDLNRLNFYLIYKETSSGKLFKKEFLVYMSPLPIEKLEEKKINRINILILFISASIFSIFAGMRNLQQMIQENKSRDKPE